MRKIILAALAIITATATISAQSKAVGSKTRIDAAVEIDKTVHDFGDVLIDAGPLSCTFTIKNISSKAMLIYNVVSSCGCTDVKWTREPLQSGKTGTISATYSNDEGPYPFDKTLTVYFSNVKKPVILRLRGSVHEKKQPLSQLYPIHFGNFAMKSTEIKCGNMSQGSQRSDRIQVANLGKTPLDISFENVSPGLNLSVSPNPIPPESKAEILYTITASEERWGKNWYKFSPSVSGRKLTALDKNNKRVDNVAIWAFTKADFSSLTKEETDNGARPMFDQSTFAFSKVKEGTVVEAVFSLNNRGKSDFKVYKVDSDYPKTQSETVPVVKPGKSGSFKVKVNTSGMPKGDSVTIITLTTNSPLRPVINLFITGEII